MTTRPPEEDTTQPAGSRAAASVIELWVSPERRARNRGRPLSLAETLEAGHGDAAGLDRDPELEAEP